MGADGVGEVVAPKSHPLHGKLVMLGASLGWDDNPLAPEAGPNFGIFGSVKQTSGRGTFVSEVSDSPCISVYAEHLTQAEYMAIEEDRCVPCPEHLSSGDDVVTAAAIPLGAVTAWR